MFKIYTVSHVKNSPLPAFSHLILKKICQVQLHKDEHLTCRTVDSHTWTPVHKIGYIAFYTFSIASRIFFTTVCAIVQQKPSPICVNFASLFTPKWCFRSMSIGKELFGLPPPKLPRTVVEGVPSTNPSHGPAKIPKPRSATAPHAWPFAPPRQKDSGAAHGVESYLFFSAMYSTRSTTTGTMLLICRPRRVAIADDALINLFSV